ncbi:hypothetical protein FACS1894190_00330 [Spirochaetia bacterium]|nr:hypothetical protein FACS1894190_00330 [Spirochaetia bacterium]
MNNAPPIAEDAKPAETTDKTVTKKTSGKPSEILSTEKRPNTIPAKKADKPAEKSGKKEAKKNTAEKDIFVPASAGSGQQTPKMPPAKRNRLNVLPFFGTDPYTGESLAWHLANKTIFKDVFDVVPFTPNNGIVKTDKASGESEGKDQDYENEYILASYIKKYDSKKMFFCTIINAATKELVAGDFLEYIEIDKIIDDFDYMAQKLMYVVRNKKDNLKTLDVRLLMAPKSIDKTNVEIITHIISMELASTLKYKVYPYIDGVDIALEEYQKQKSKKIKFDSGNESDYTLNSKISLINSKNELLCEMINTYDNTLFCGANIEFDILLDIPDRLENLAAKLIPLR